MGSTARDLASAAGHCCRWERTAAFADLPDDPDQKTVFLKLHELRNKW